MLVIPIKDDGKVIEETQGASEEGERKVNDS